MPRSPRGKRIHTSDGVVNVAAKNPNGDGSIYYEPRVTRADGRTGSRSMAVDVPRWQRPVAASLGINAREG